MRWIIRFAGAVVLVAVLAVGALFALADRTDRGGRRRQAGHGAGTRGAPVR